MLLHFLLKIPLVSNWLVWQKAPQGLLWINAINGERFNGFFMLSCCSIFSPAFFTSESLCNSLATVSAPSGESRLSSRTSLFLCPSPSTVELGGTTKLNAGKELSQYMSRIVKILTHTLKLSSLFHSYWCTTSSEPAFWTKAYLECAEIMLSWSVKMLYPASRGFFLALTVAVTKSCAF